MPGIGMSHGQGMRLDPRLHRITEAEIIFILSMLAIKVARMRVEIIASFANATKI